MSDQRSIEEFLDNSRAEILQIPAVRGYDITLVDEQKTIRLFIEPGADRDVDHQFSKLNPDSHPYVLEPVGEIRAL